MKDKGKCYSKVNRGQRRKGDFYQTPYSMTKQFLRFILMNGFYNYFGKTLEPSCGKGAIVKVLNDLPSSHGCRLTSYDLEEGRDFLKETKTFDTLITNPPYSLANEFILKAKELKIPNIFLLLPLNYLQGQKRYTEQIFHGLKGIYIFTRMPMLSEEIREDGKYETGMQAYAWYGWEREYIEDPKIYWLDNQKYVLKKGDV